MDIPELTYELTISLLVALAGAPEVPDPGGVQLDSDPLWSWIGDNQAKGASPAPALTLHTRADVAERKWADGDESLGAELLAAASPWLGQAKVVGASVHRWRYATPVDPYPERCYVACGGNLVFAGDAFGGPRAGGAFLSGLAAARAITEP